MMNMDLSYCENYVDPDQLVSAKPVDQDSLCTTLTVSTGLKWNTACKFDRKFGRVVAHTDNYNSNLIWHTISHRVDDGMIDP